MDSKHSLPASCHLEKLIEMAVAEDLGPGDVTSYPLSGSGLQGEGFITAKEPLVVAGLEAAEKTFLRIDPEVSFMALCREGNEAEAGTRVAEVSGAFHSLLTAERIALNFLQRLSGIATNVRGYVKELYGRDVRLVDTRKTVPGWRALEKYAVRVGGACNHRMGLYDGILIKENHISAFGSIEKAVEETRRHSHHLLQIEVEASTVEEVEQALAAGADVIMLDNMNDSQIRESVEAARGRALIEVSGRVEKSSLSALADLGADIISAGSLIHSARFADLSMTIHPAGSRD